MIESILISIVANIITGVGQKTLKKLINDNSLETEINKAFDSALDKWTVNYGIREKEKIFTRKRFEILLECLKTPETIGELDKETVDLIELFKLELQKSLPAWNYIQDEQFKAALLKLNTIEHHLNGLKDDLISQIKGLEKIFDDALISYKDAFSLQLNSENKDLPNQFHNKFIGKKTDLESIDYLIKLSSFKIISVVADGGYGKTRLCIEYFQKYVDTDEDIEAWVLNTTAFKSLDFSSQLKNDKTNIILIDDAHKYPKILNDVVNIANRHKNVKILMTIRRALYDDTIAEIARHNRNSTSHKIERLSYEETKELFKSQLPWLKDFELIRLAEHSKGIPIVVLGLCQVTINGKYKTELSEEENFRLFVHELKKQVINDIHGKYLIDKGKINKTIELLSFFSPIKNIDEEIAVISRLNGIEVEETNLILDHLEEHEFIFRGVEIVIKPDPYSDTILLDSSIRIKYLLQKDIHPFLDRLIRNLIEVEQSERLDLNVNSLLSEFITSFKNKSTETSEEIYSLVSNLETLKSFAYKKPRICFLALKDLIDSKINIDDFWQTEEIHVLYEKSFKEVHENLVTIFSIIALNTREESELDELYELMWIYKSKKINTNIFQQVFGYRVYDFSEYGYRKEIHCQRQTFLLKKLESLLTKNPDDEFFLNHIFECIKTLMALEFEGESFYDKYTYSFSWQRYRVPFNELQVQLRLNSLNLLLKIYSLSRHKKFSQDYFLQILRTLFFMAKNKQENREFNKSKEVDLVIDFINSILDDKPSIVERSKIILQLKLFERREIKEGYKEISDELLKKSETVSTPKDKLALLFRDEYFSLRKNIEKKLSDIIEQYPDNESFFKELIEVKNEIVENDFSNFHEILSFLIKEHPDKSKELLELVISNYPEQACDFSGLIKANYKDSEYFYSTIDKIWNLEFECTKGAVLWMLTNGRNKEIEFYTDADLKYFEYVVDNKLVNQLHSISFSIAKYILINPARTLDIISGIFEISENMRQEGFLLHSIFEDKSILEEHSELIKEFVFTSTIEFPIDHHYSNDVLCFLENYFGFDLLFDYLKEKILRIEEKKQTLYLSYHKHYNNPNKTPIQCESDFIKVIKWYSDLDSKSDYIHKVLVEFLRPNEITSDNFKAEFKALINDAGDKVEKIIDLCKALDVYENKNERLIALLIDIANEICEKYKIEDDMLIELFGYDYIRNLGAKSGPAGGPFPQDIEKKRELNDIIKNHKMHPKVEEIFRYALSKVNGDIERNLFNDEKW
jgi:hypothetical protein